MLALSNVSVQFKGTKKIIKNINYSLPRNKILGIVGESGSGKSVSSLAIMGLLPKTATIGGSIVFDGIDLTTLHEEEIQKLRGNRIAMIFQEPMSSLNPTLTCGHQVAEILKKHGKVNSAAIKSKVIELFEQVKLPRAAQLYHNYPHEISGGQKQRVMIAMAIACKPDVLIADESTTALDVTVQKEIVLLLKELQETSGMSIVFISHDLALVSEIADHVIVMHKGTIVEQGTAAEVFLNPKENYTKALINSRPNSRFRLKKLPTVQDYMAGTVHTALYTDEEREKFHNKLYEQPPLLRVEGITKHYKSGGGFLTPEKVVTAVNDVSFKLYEGETLGLVGESGCGKSTLGRSILQLETIDQGEIYYRGKSITSLKKGELKALRKEIQIIFQDPFSSLNPRIPVGQAILEPMKVHKILKNKAERTAYVLELLEKVGLQKEHFDRYPHEFSGGQRQRIGIARTIALQPKLIICDESVSALDVSVQAQVLNLLNELKAEYKFSYIFISHDLSVVKYMSDQLLVMNGGKLEEIDDADQVYRAPKSTYTQALIDAIPKGI